jgi:hypothetical protein
MRTPRTTGTRRTPRTLGRTTWTLAWRLLRGGGRHGDLGVGLSVAASALCTPLRVLDAARRTESVLPGAVLAGGAVVTGLFCAAPLTFAGGTPHLDGRGVTLLAGCLALGFAGLAGASAASRPLLREVVRDAGPRPD